MAKSEHGNKIVFQALNDHADGCGPPPSFSNRDGNKYHGYFKNQFGEQFVFVYNRDTGTGVLYGGDCDWKTEMPVAEMPYEEVVTRMIEKSGLPRAEVEKLFDQLPLQSMHRLPSGNFVVVPGWIIGRDEMTWLAACWQATHPFTSLPPSTSSSGG